MGEKGQAALQNMDFISDAGHFIQGAGNAAQHMVQGVVNDLGTNNDPAQQAADLAAIQAAYARQNAGASQGAAAQATPTPIAQAPQAGEKGNMQAMPSQIGNQASALAGDVSRPGPIATSGPQAGTTSPTVGGASPTAGPTINPNPPIK